MPALTGIPKGDARQKRLGEDWKEIFERKYLHRVRAFPKTRALFERLRAEGLRRERSGRDHHQLRRRR
ncbi:hypothetical protein OFC56_38525, partial [Escherichia coli]|nr:hypothetical protein [Escherichia coli]